MVSFKDLVNELIKISSIEFDIGCLGKNTAMSKDKVVAITPEGFWEKKLGHEGYINVDITDFYPEIVYYGTEVIHVVFYLKYKLPSPIYDQLHKKEISEISYKAVPLLTMAYLFKKYYENVYIYLNINKLVPLLIRPHRFEEKEEGYEGIIAPRII